MGKGARPISHKLSHTRAVRSYVDQRGFSPLLGTKGAQPTPMISHAFTAMHIVTSPLFATSPEFFHTHTHTPFCHILTPFPMQFCHVHPHTIPYAVLPHTSSHHSLCSLATYILTPFPMQFCHAYILTQFPMCSFCHIPRVTPQGFAIIYS
jgi:hypothetical protein